ncbi:anhydro-N-acetylmuramic acid kinase [Chamaesiphon sp. VAR_48_metabat_135_sub]|uniref:anhydro-N-acetylmuramic acid kinase n=1 Tax=Chamaesiphon sp. VAR_48_metabat_135_sub TaxID=2964699 RepID=UPI00286B20D0|nr:anhydro-N-acetylmuramic acid kinase [Chamaesiphon sp. VAR_48_metabat_135_sub]
MKVIGLMSGTSVDGIDAALVEISGTTLDLRVELLAGETYPYPDNLRSQILGVCGGEKLSMQELAELDDGIARCFGRAANEIQTNQSPATLIGSHGQTVFHRPTTAETMGYSLQLGRGELIASIAKITTIDNFRAGDIAAGGQGAPLVPKPDAYLLGHPSEHRCVQNIGGIGNVTYLPPHSQPNWEDKVCGWDTGPGNSLLDLAVNQLSQGELTFDRDGGWAATGKVCQPLVQKWLAQDYFRLSPPKSTGRELFGVDYLQACIADANVQQLTPADLLATLTDLTASSIADSYRRFLPQLPDCILLCGGGSRNLYIHQRLQSHLPNTHITTTDAAGVNGDYKEAIAFAVLAYWRHFQIPGNLPVATGAKQHLLLGDVHHLC